MLQKGVYPYEYKDDRKFFLKHYNLKKEFYYSLNAEDITDRD